MDNMCLISFIIPLYNLKDFIIPCLESIYRSQFNHNFEIIVWDDGSLDDSAQVVKRYAHTHYCIRLISEINRGVSYVRNHAVVEAKGKYVWFVDSDDEVNPNTARSLVELASNLELDLLLFNWKPIDMAGQQENFILHKVNSSNIISGRELYMNHIISMAPWCYIYRREFLLENKLKFPEDFRTCEDIQFNQKALWYAKKAMSSESVGYFYRKMNASATQGNSSRLVQDQIRRIPIEIDFFSKFEDWKYLTAVLYRNLREINVWIGLDKSPSSCYQKISEVLSNKDYKISPVFSFMALYIYLMRVKPHLISNLQRIAKNIKLLLH